MFHVKWKKQDVGSSDINVEVVTRELVPDIRVVYHSALRERREEKRREEKRREGKRREEKRREEKRREEKRSRQAPLLAGHY
jgi:hypothetical protein